MKNHIVRRFPRLLPSSFTSCQFRHVPDIVETSNIATTKSTQILRKNDESSPFSRIHSKSSFSEPHKSKTLKNDGEVYKIHDRSFSMGSYQQKEIRSAQLLKLKNNSSSNGGWFSSEDSLVDGESNTFFSLSSGSSESFHMKTSQNHEASEVSRCSSEISLSSIGNIKTCQKYDKTVPKPEMVHGVDEEAYEIPGIPAELYYADHYHRSFRRSTTKSGRKPGKNRRRRTRGNLNAGEVAGSCPVVVDGRVEDSYAVEKTSSDPHSDFRISMVEMIVEKRIFGAEDLERLLSSFLSLNSPCYHEVIIEVFLEICETLFTN